MTMTSQGNERLLNFLNLFSLYFTFVRSVGGLIGTRTALHISCYENQCFKINIKPLTIRIILECYVGVHKLNLP